MQAAQQLYKMNMVHHLDRALFKVNQVQLLYCSSLPSAMFLYNFTLFLYNFT